MATNYSVVEYIADGITEQFAVNFPSGYIKQADVFVSIDGVDTVFTWLSEGLLALSPAPVVGAYIRVYRSTEIITPVNNYQDGSVIIEKNLDDSFAQTLFVTQEVYDRLENDTLLVDTADGAFDASSRIIKNVASPVNDTDAATKGWVNISYNSGVDAGLAQIAAEAARDIAIAKADIATAQAVIATAQAVIATDQASISTDKATEALASADSASTSATTATTQAGIATTQAGIATTQATSASNSADLAATYVPPQTIPSVVDFSLLTGITDGNVIFITDPNHGDEFVYDTSILKTAHDGWNYFDPDINMTTWAFSSASAGFGVLRRLEKLKKSSLSFIFDDEYSSHYVDVLPLFESRDYPVALAITPKFVNDTGVSTGRMNTGEILDSQKRGCELINHSMTHANLSATTSYERVIAEVNTAKHWLDERSINSSGFLAASSALNSTMVPYIDNSCDYAMTVYANNDIDICAIDEKADSKRLSRWTMDGISSAATIAAITTAVTSGKSLIMYDHDVPNPSTAYTELVAVLDFVDSISGIVDVDLPRELVAKHLGIESSLNKFKEETPIFYGPNGWTVSPGLGAVITSNEIQLTPTATGAQTVTKDITVNPDENYSFSCNVRSGSWTGTVSMGVHCLDSGNAIIAGYSIEGGNIEYDGENLTRHSIQAYAPDNAAKLRLFFRVNPTAVDATTLLIRDPCVYTGTRILVGDTFPAPTVEVFSATQDFDLSKGARDFYIRLDSNPTTFNAPTNMSDMDEITLHMRANGVNRNITWNAIFRLNPNTIYNTNATGDLMIVKFKYYRSEWIQMADVAWIA